MVDGNQRLQIPVGGTPAEKQRALDEIFGRGRFIVDPQSGEIRKRTPQEFAAAFRRRFGFRADGRAISQEEQFRQAEAAARSRIQATPRIQVPRTLQQQQQLRQLFQTTQTQIVEPVTRVVDVGRRRTPADIFRERRINRLVRLDLEKTSALQQQETALRAEASQLEANKIQLENQINARLRGATVGPNFQQLSRQVDSFNSQAQAFQSRITAFNQRVEKRNEQVQVTREQVAAIQREAVPRRVLPPKPKEEKKIPLAAKIQLAKARAAEGITREPTAIPGLFIEKRAEPPAKPGKILTPEEFFKEQQAARERAARERLAKTPKEAFEETLTQILAAPTVGVPVEARVAGAFIGGGLVAISQRRKRARVERFERLGIFEEAEAVKAEAVEEAGLLALGLVGVTPIKGVPFKPIGFVTKVKVVSPKIRVLQRKGRLPETVFTGETLVKGEVTFFGKRLGRPTRVTLPFEEIIEAITTTIPKKARVRIEKITKIPGIDAGISVKDLKKSRELIVGTGKEAIRRVRRAAFPTKERFFAEGEIGIEFGLPEKTLVRRVAAPKAKIERITTAQISGLLGEGRIGRARIVSQVFRKGEAPEFFGRFVSQEAILEKGIPGRVVVDGRFAGKPLDIRLQTFLGRKKFKPPSPQRQARAAEKITEALTGFERKAVRAVTIEKGIPPELTAILARRAARVVRKKVAKVEAPLRFEVGERPSGIPFGRQFQRGLILEEEAEMIGLGVGQRPIIALGEITGIKEAERLRTGLLPVTALKFLEALKTKQPLKPRQVPKIGQLPAIKEIPALKPVQIPKEKERLAEKLKQPPRERLLEIPRGIEKPRIPKIKIKPPRVPGILPVLGLPFERKPKPKEKVPIKVRGFDVLVRERRPTKLVKGRKRRLKVKALRKGKFRRVNREPLSRGQALARGSQVTDSTLAATFKIRRAKKRAKPVFGLGFGLSPKFRMGKKGEFIEKKRFRLDTPSEKRGITVAKFLAEERKRRAAPIFGLETIKRKKKKRGKRGTISLLM